MAKQLSTAETLPIFLLIRCSLDPTLCGTVYVNYHYLITIIIIIIVIIIIVTFISKVIDCGVLPTPVKASKVLETHTRVDGMVRFKCTEKGYEISGSEIRKCLNTGLWSGTKTKCTSKLGSKKKIKKLSINKLNIFTLKKQTKKKNNRNLKRQFTPTEKLFCHLSWVLFVLPYSYQLWRPRISHKW